MAKVPIGKVILILILVAIFCVAYFFKINQYLSLAGLKSVQFELMDYQVKKPIFFSFMFFCTYILVSALSLPGATILTLAGGVFFGLVKGLILVSFASSVGATLALLMSRHLFRDFVRKRFKDRIDKIDQGFKREGAFYLFTLRLLPIFPFFLVNLIMGLTSISALTFLFVSQIGMLAGTAVYVNAGTQLAQITSISGLLSTHLILSFSLIGILPLLSKRVIELLKRQRRTVNFKKPAKFDYNLIVIGGGSAGLVSAYIASAVKAKVALIEKHKMGGDCLNTGCVPSKALIKSAKILNYIKRSQEFGIEISAFNLDFEKVMNQIQETIKRVEPHDSVERYSELGVDCISGAAFIKSPFEIEINGKTLTTKSIIVATGARPMIPSLPGLELIEFLTSDNIWSLRKLPRRLVVLGSGPIGCEIAQSIARFGSRVTIVEMDKQILSREDSEVSEILDRTLRKDGIDILTGHKAVRVETLNKENFLFCEVADKTVKIPFDQILIAVGRKPNVTGFGLENLGIEISERGTIVADAFLRTTNYSNIYVCGDVTGPFQFTHAASHQAWYCAVNALFGPFKKFKVDYRVIPWCTFTDPEIARVGLNEQEATAQAIPYEITKYDIEDLDRAIVEKSNHGFVKILTKPGTDKILGVTIVGVHGGELITEFVTAMKFNLGLKKILSTIHIYPTYSEANKYAAGVWQRNHAPAKILSYLKAFHHWRRS